MGLFLLILIWSCAVGGLLLFSRVNSSLSTLLLLLATLVTLVLLAVPRQDRDIKASEWWQYTRVLRPGETAFILREKNRVGSDPKFESGSKLFRESYHCLEFLTIFKICKTVKRSQFRHIGIFQLAYAFFNHVGLCFKS